MITQEYLKSVLYYDPNTGLFTWICKKKIKNNKKYAGYKDKDGYLIITINGKAYKAHRLVFMYVYGIKPKKEVDHINGIVDDNRLINLREANKSSNLQNQKRAHKNNLSTGLLGAHKQNNLFTSCIRHNGKQIHLGCFKTAEDAHNAYIEAKRKLHPYGTL